MEHFISNDEFFLQNDLSSLEARDLTALLKEWQMNNYKYYLQLLKNSRALRKNGNRVLDTSELLEVNEKKTPLEEKEVLDVSFYIQQIKNCQNEADFLSILPKKSHYQFERIMNTIIMYYVQECNEIEQFLVTETLTDEEKKEFLEEVKEKKKFIQKFISYRDQIPTKEEKNVKNHLVYLTSSSGNVYALSDLKSIDIEYYDSFLELFHSIIDGTFKNIKMFSNNNKINQLYEVKNFKTRIVFAPINLNTFIIISVFMKKADNDLKYREQIINRSLKYHSRKQMIKFLCQEDEFIKEQSFITEELLQSLTLERERNR